MRDDTLGNVVNRVVNNHDLSESLVLLDSLEKVNELYSFTVVWNFSEGIPQFEYQDTSKRLLVNDEPAQVQFKSVKVHPDRWLDAEIPHIMLTRYLPESEDDVDLKPLHRSLSEIQIGVDVLAEIIAGENREEEYRVEHVTISAFTTELAALARDTVDSVTSGRGNSDPATSTGPDEAIQLLIVFGGQYHVDIDRIYSQWRFNHVKWINVDGESYPVDITTKLCTEEYPGYGKLIHTDDFFVEHTDVEKMDFADEIRKIDLDELLHEESSWPQ